MRLDNNLIPASNLLSYPKLDEESIVVKTTVYKAEPYKEINFNESPPQFYYNKDELLFSRRKLIRDGILTTNRDSIIAAYDVMGKLIEMHSQASLFPSVYKSEGIKLSIDKNRFYKDRYFKKFDSEKDVTEETEVPIICIIDEIPFATQTAAANYL